MRHRIVTGLLLLLVLSAIAGAQDEPRNAAVVPRWEVTDEPVLGLNELLPRAGDLVYEQMSGAAPHDGGAFWLGVIVAIAVGFSFRPLLTRRNLLLLLLLVPSLLFINSNAWADEFHRVEVWSLFTWIQRVFIAIVAVLFLRALFGRVGSAAPWKPGVEGGRLRALTLALVACNLWLIAATPQGDASRYINLGAQRFRESGELPYSDPWLRDGAGSAYGVGFHLMLRPLHALVDPEPLNEHVERPTAYERSSQVPARILGLLFHLLSCLALFRLARACGGAEIAWGILALYAGSAYVLGIGGAQESICGVRHLSETGPTCFSLLAWAALASAPLLAGLLLGASVAFSLHLVLLFPLAFFWLRSRRGAVRPFLVGFAVAGVLVTAAVVGFSGDEGGLVGAVRNYVEQQVVHQMKPNEPDLGLVGYYDSPWGFWGTHPDLRDAVFAEIAGGFRWIHLALIAVVVFWSFRARRANLAELCLGAAAVTLAVQLARPHASATHFMWYLPFLLVGNFGTAGRSSK